MVKPSAYNFGGSGSQSPETSSNKPRTYNVLGSPEAAPATAEERALKPDAFENTSVEDILNAQYNAIEGQHEKKYKKDVRREVAGQMIHTAKAQADDLRYEHERQGVLGQTTEWFHNTFNDGDSYNNTKKHVKNTREEAYALVDQLDTDDAAFSKQYEKLTGIKFDMERPFITEDDDRLKDGKWGGMIGKGDKKIEGYKKDNKIGSIVQGIFFPGGIAAAMAADDNSRRNGRTEYTAKDYGEAIGIDLAVTIGTAGIGAGFGALGKAGRIAGRGAATASGANPTANTTTRVLGNVKNWGSNLKEGYKWAKDNPKQFGNILGQKFGKNSAQELLGLGIGGPAGSLVSPAITNKLIQGTGKTSVEGSIQVGSQNGANANRFVGNATPEELAPLLGRNSDGIGDGADFFTPQLFDETAGLGGNATNNSSRLPGFSNFPNNLNFSNNFNNLVSGSGNFFRQGFNDASRGFNTFTSGTGAFLNRGFSGSPSPSELTPLLGRNSDGIGDGADFFNPQLFDETAGLGGNMASGASRSPSFGNVSNNFNNLVTSSNNIFRQGFNGASRGFNTFTSGTGAFLNRGAESFSNSLRSFASSPAKNTASAPPIMLSYNPNTALQARNQTAAALLFQGGGLERSSFLEAWDSVFMTRNANGQLQWSDDILTNFKNLTDQNSLQPNIYNALVANINHFKPNSLQFFEQLPAYDDVVLPNYGAITNNISGGINTGDDFIPPVDISSLSSTPVFKSENQLSDIPTPSGGLVDTPPVRNIESPPSRSSSLISNKGSNENSLTRNVSQLHKNDAPTVKQKSFGEILGSTNPWAVMNEPRANNGWTQIDYLAPNLTVDNWKELYKATPTQYQDDFINKAESIVNGLDKDMTPNIQTFLNDLRTETV